MAEGPTMPAMPLSMVHAGDTVTVKRVRGNEDMKRHLGNLGFVDGSRVHVISSSGGNIIVTVKGARLGLDARVAQHVMTV
ncbi:FeoA family protein [Collinsella sp. An307]|uniref:FeoA family protein n=1 Tax=Collinsella sp. An307 TaxID=1965630 RepID=UPI0031B7F5D7